MALNEVTNPRFNIICLPCGGGSASSFYSWKSFFPESNLWALKLPGRDSRIAEPFIILANHIVEVIIENLSQNFREPLIIYGHSMGAGIAFQTVAELFKLGMPLPQLLILSGREAPHFTYNNVTTEMDDEQLIRYIEQLGGATRTIPRHLDFLNQYLIKIRADYQLNSSIATLIPQSLPVKISLINGSDDPLIDFERLHQWSQHTEYPINSNVLPGGHFFCEEFFEKFMLVVQQQISHLVETVI